MGKIVTLLALVLLCFAQQVSAQAMKGYKLGVGVKVGKFSSGVSGKYFIGVDNSTAIEASLTVKKNFGTGLLTGFYIKQIPFFNHSLKIPLDIYFGAGAHVATYKEGYYRIRNGEKDSYYGRGISMGVDAVVGLEYVPAKWPVSFSVEAIPMLDLVNRGPEKVELAMAVRLLF